MYCQRCGEFIPENQNFCSHCGLIAVYHRTGDASITFKEAVKRFFVNSFRYGTRAGFREFWYAAGFCVLVVLLVIFLRWSLWFGWLMPLLYPVLALALGVPLLSLQIRRLHDVGRSGWFWWIGLVPVAGIVILLVQYAKNSAPDNRWGKTSGH